MAANYSPVLQQAKPPSTGNLLSLIELLSARKARHQPVVADYPPTLAPVSTNSFDQVIGQHRGKRALVNVAADICRRREK